MLKNAVNLAHHSDSFYAFLRGYGQMQRYDRAGNLQWDKELNLPFMDKIYEAFVERNKQMPGGTISILNYAYDIEATGDGVYLLMNAPEKQSQVLLWIEKDGTLSKKYVFEYPDSNFSSLSVSPDQSLMYLIDGSRARILSLNLENIK